MGSRCHGVAVFAGAKLVHRIHGPKGEYPHIKGSPNLALAVEGLRRQIQLEPGLYFSEH